MSEMNGQVQPSDDLYEAMWLWLRGYHDVYDMQERMDPAAISFAVTARNVARGLACCIFKARSGHWPTGTEVDALLDASKEAWRERMDAFEKQQREGGVSLTTQPFRGDEA